MNILVIDDDTDVKESTQVMLMDEGYKVETACDGMNGIKLYKKVRPEITFLDLKMPGMDGYETFQKIKQFDSNAKVIFITGYAYVGLKQKNAIKNKILATIKKPVDVNQLLKIIKKYN